MVISHLVFLESESWVNATDDRWELLESKFSGSPF